MFGVILSWLTGGGIAAIGKELRQAHKDRLDAANDSERIAADVRIKELEARQSSILAAQADRYERWVRIGFALPFVLYNLKLVAYDKVLGLGSTDPLSAELSHIQMVVISGYFLHASIRAVRK